MIMRLSVLRLLVSAACITGPLAAQKASPPPLFQLTNVQGPCEVKKPDSTTFEPAINRKAYPFGTTIRTGPAGKAFVILAPAYDNTPSASVLMAEIAELVVDRDPEAVTNGIVRLQTGKIKIYAEIDTPAKALTVETVAYGVSDFTGLTEVHVLPATTNLIPTRVVVAKGGVKVTGEQFMIADMRAGCAFLIETSADRSLTRMTGESGETAVTLDNGTDEPLVFMARPRSIIKLWREFAPVGGRQIIAVFAVGPDGKRPECYAYAVGQPGMVSSEVAGDDPIETADGEPAAGAVAPAAAGATPAATVPTENADAAFKELFGDSFSF